MGSMVCGESRLRRRGESWGATCAVVAALVLMASSAPAATLEVGSASGDPGDVVTFDVRLHTQGQTVAAAENVLRFDARNTPIAGKGGGKADCTVNPAIDKNQSTFLFRPSGCGQSTPCTEVRPLVLSFENVDPIADGAALYTCRVAIPAEARPGVYALAISDVGFSDDLGTSLPSASGTNGAITVRGTVVPSPLAYFSSSAGITVVDTGTNQSVDTVSLPEPPSFMSLSPDGSTVYATGESASIYVVDTATRRLKATIIGDPRYTGVSFSPDSRIAYAVRYLADPPSSISLIDTATDQITGNIPLFPDIVVRMGVRPDGRKGYVPRTFAFLPEDPFDITVVDLQSNRVETTIPIPCGEVMFDLAFTPDGHRLYVPVLGGGDVCHHPPASTAGAAECPGDCSGDARVGIDELILGVNIVLGTASLESCAGLAASAPAMVSDLVKAVNSALYGCGIPKPEGDFTAIIDTDTQELTGVIDFGKVGAGLRTSSGGGPAGTGTATVPGLGIAIAPDGRFAYVTSCGDGLCVIDLSSNTVVDTIALPDFPYNIDITPDGRFAYVTDNGTEPVSVVDLDRRTLIGSVDVPRALDVAIGPP